MSLTRLNIEAFRNIQSAQLIPSPGINVIYGQNGSGKTSILEAIYFLGMGRSFRSHLSQRVINHDDDKLTLFLYCLKAQNPVDNLSIGAHFMLTHSFMALGRMFVAFLNKEINCLETVRLTVIFNFGTKSLCAMPSRSPKYETIM